MHTHTQSASVSVSVSAHSHSGCWLLPAPVCCWLLLAAGWCWLVLAAAGCCWLAAGCCWLLLAGAGCCWLLLHLEGRGWPVTVVPELFLLAPLGQACVIHPLFQGMGEQAGSLEVSPTWLIKAICQTCVQILLVSCLLVLLG